MPQWPPESEVASLAAFVAVAAASTVSSLASGALSAPLLAARQFAPVEPLAVFYYGQWAGLCGTTGTS